MPNKSITIIPGHVSIQSKTIQFNNLIPSNPTIQSSSPIVKIQTPEGRSRTVKLYRSSTPKFCLGQYSIKITPLCVANTSLRRAETSLGVLQQSAAVTIETLPLQIGCLAETGRWQRRIKP